MTLPSPKRTHVFLCYDAKDQTRKDELMEQLAYYQRFWSIDVWDNERILAGMEVKAEITNALALAKVAVLLVSASFLASAWITEYQLPVLLKAAEEEGLRLIPILLSPCLYQNTELKGFQYINPPARSNGDKHAWVPLSRMNKHRRSEIWVQVVEELRQELREINQQKQGTGQTNKDQAPDAHFTSMEKAEQSYDDKAFANEYCTALRNDPLLAKVQILDMDHSLALEDLYVRVQIHHESRFRYPIEYVEQGQQDPLSIFHWHQKFLEENKRVGMEPAIAVRKHPHCVIVGDPGAGKTTLLKYLALQGAQGKLGGIANCPVFVSLHDFARKIRKNESLIEYILEEWERVYHLSREQARDFLERQMHAGCILLLFDALDETMIGDESTQAEQTYQTVHEAVSDLHRCYPQTPMVVTARKAAYHQHAHLIGFDLLEVVDFLSEQVEAFIKNWFRHDPHEERRNMGEGLLTRLKNNPRISSLAANPLLLGLIAYTYEENNERLPANRADLYKLCIETLLRKWDDKRKIRRAHTAIDTYEQERLLPRLAWHFHSQGLRYFTQREVLTCIREFAEALGKSTHEEHLQDILHEITSDNGLLREQASGYYGFLHLTLQEYFTARHLTNIHGLELLLERLGHPWWEEVILLYAGQVDDASDLLERLLSPGSFGEATEDIFYNKLLLAGHCLAAQVQIIRNKQLRRRIPDMLLKKLHYPYMLLQQQVADVLAEIGRAYPQDEVNDQLFTFVEDRETDEELRTIVLNGISVAGSRRLQRQLLPLIWQLDPTSQQPYLDWNTRHKVIAIMEQSIDQASLQDAKVRLAQEDLPLEVRENIITLLCQCTDTATFKWLLDWQDKANSVELSASVFSILRSQKRDDLSFALPYALRFLKKPRSQVSHIFYGTGVLLLEQFPSTENILYLEKIVYDKTFSIVERANALWALTRLNHLISNKYLYRILVNPEEEELHEATVECLIRQNQPNQQEKLLAILQSKETPPALRLTIATQLVNLHPQEIIPVLWEIYQSQREKPMTRENIYFFLQPLIMLLEQKDKNALQPIIEVLENINNDNSDSLETPTRSRKKCIYLLVPNSGYYISFSENMAKRVVDLADAPTLNAFCSNRRIHVFIRRDLINQIAQVGKQTNIYISTLLTEFTDLATLEDVRMTLAEILGTLATDEQTIATLLKLYQEELLPCVKDALYTALYKIARRTNITIVPDMLNENELRIIRR